MEGSRGSRFTKDELLSKLANRHLVPIKERFPSKERDRSVLPTFGYLDGRKKEGFDGPTRSVSRCQLEPDLGFSRWYRSSDNRTLERLGAELKVELLGHTRGEDREGGSRVEEHPALPRVRTPGQASLDGRGELAPLLERDGKVGQDERLRALVPRAGRQPRAPYSIRVPCSSTRNMLGSRPLAAVRPAARAFRMSLLEATILRFTMATHSPGWRASSETGGRGDGGCRGLPGIVVLTSPSGRVLISVVWTLTVRRDRSRVRGVAPDRDPPRATGPDGAGMRPSLRHRRGEVGFPLACLRPRSLLVIESVLAKLSQVARYPTTGERNDLPWHCRTWGGASKKQGGPGAELMTKCYSTFDDRWGDSFIYGFMRILSPKEAPNRGI